MNTNPLWYQAFEPRPAARVRLYCLPCAGGGASSYRPWTPFVPEWAELRAIRLPGRQARHREPSFDDCDTAARAIAGWLSEEDTPYALFGHSMGAMLAYRATRFLLADGARPPVFVASACWPVRGVPPTTMPATTDDDETFCAKVAGMGGSASELLADPDVRELVLPVLRADFALCHTYRYHEEPPLPMPVSVYGGTDDPVTVAENLQTWQAHADRLIGPRLFPGGHFFLQERPDEFAGVVFDDLAAALRTVPVPADRGDHP
jgi:surfactin synthase thioesterase subunit